MSRFLLIITAALTLHSCFTGVESTPRVSESEVKRQGAAVPSAERILISSVKPQALAQWSPGKMFLVSDLRVALIFRSETKVATGDTLTFRGVQEGITVMNDTVADLIFSLPGADSVVYRTEMSVDDAMQALNSVPYTVDLDLVRDADRLLRGRKVWTLTAMAGGKFTPATISSVQPGNADFPLNVIFTDATGAEHSLLMAAESNSRTARTFDHLFSLSDPRKRYSSIPDHTWSLITQGRVERGMTRLECRLALGSPSDVDRTASTSAILERWLYEGGSYLIFEDDILTRYRL